MGVSRRSLWLSFSNGYVDRLEVSRFPGREGKRVILVWIDAVVQVCDGHVRNATVLGRGQQELRFGQ
jgi:hypothetical protein